MQQRVLSPADLAQILYEEMIERPHILAFNLVMDEAATENFQNKTKLYQVAAIMMAIMSVAEKDKRFNKVKDALERLIFPPSPTPVALDLVSRLRIAMADLSRLLFPANPRNQFSWARAWLSDIGVEESNPVNLAIFATQCMDYFIGARKILDRFQLQV